ncbi:MAG: hypothetical protein LBE12_15480 [Planctomycetaceae bacterium]|jgi:hypothetical protein|nr:hypothetical protein [Planctomycetaceae bacterium]
MQCDTPYCARCTNKNDRCGLSQEVHCNPEVDPVSGIVIRCDATCVTTTPVTPCEKGC